MAHYASKDTHLIMNNPTSGHPPHYKQSYPSHLTSELNIIRSTGEQSVQPRKKLTICTSPLLMINLTTPKLKKLHQTHNVDQNFQYPPSPKRKMKNTKKILTNEKTPN